MEGFTKQRTVYFSDTDAAGIVYFARFFDFAHEALEEYLLAKGVSIPDVLAAGDYLWPITRSECLYKSPVRLHDKLAVSVAVIANGDHGMQTVCKVVNETAGKEAAEVTIEHTFISALDWTKVPIPGDARKLLE